jgi:DNA-binding transcriptional ArsR family regulator
MKIKYNVVMDYLMTLSHYFNREFIDSIIAEYNFEINPMVEKTFELLDEELSYYQKSDFKMLFSNFINYLILTNLVNQENIETMEDFEKALEEFKSNEYKEMLLKVLNIEEGEFTKDDIINSPFLLKLDTIEDFEVEGELIYEYINNPNHTLKRLKENVMIPSELFMKEIYGPNQEKLKEILSIHQKDIDELGDDFYKKRMHYVDHIQSNEIEDIYLNIIAPTGLIHDTDSGLLIYSHDMSVIDVSGMKDFEYLEFIKAISDKKRIKIVKALNKDSLCNNDLAELLDLTPATISYHISKLVREKIINVKKGEYNKIMYSIDEEQLKKRFKEASEYLVK